MLPDYGIDYGRYKKYGGQDSRSLGKFKEQGRESAQSQRAHIPYFCINTSEPFPPRSNLDTLGFGLYSFAIEAILKSRLTLWTSMLVCIRRCAPSSIQPVKADFGSTVCLEPGLCLPMMFLYSQSMWVSSSLVLIEFQMYFIPKGINVWFMSIHVPNVRYSS